MTGVGGDVYRQTDELQARAAKGYTVHMGSGTRSPSPGSGLGQHEPFPKYAVLAQAAGLTSIPVEERGNGDPDLSPSAHRHRPEWLGHVLQDGPSHVARARLKRVLLTSRFFLCPFTSDRTKRRSITRATVREGMFIRWEPRPPMRLKALETCTATVIN